MSLENFRKLRIDLHHINDPILKKLVAKEGDYNGRELEVQLTNRYVLQNQEGVKLRLYWRNLKHGNQGIKNFEPVDAENGLFKVVYPNQMLNAANVSCFIQIQDAGRPMGTKNFTVTVEGSGFDAQTAIASDDYLALNEALIELGQYQSDIDSIKEDLNRQVNQLVENYEPELQGLKEQFNDVLSNITADDEVITARTSTNTGESHTTIGVRLDDMEMSHIVENTDNGERFKSSLKIVDGKPFLEMEEI